MQPAIPAPVERKAPPPTGARRRWSCRQRPTESVRTRPSRQRDSLRSGCLVQFQSRPQLAKPGPGRTDWQHVAAVENDVGGKQRAQKPKVSIAEDCQPENAILLYKLRL